MKKHTQVYYHYFDYSLEDFVYCELSGQRAVDIHHIEARGVGGSKKEEKIENLMALTRELHREFGDITELIPQLQKMHFQFMQTSTPIFDHTPTRKEILEWKEQ